MIYIEPLVTLIIVIILIVVWFYLSNEKIFYTTKEYPEVKIIEDNWKTFQSELPEFSLTDSDKFSKYQRSWSDGRSIVTLEDKLNMLFIKLKENETWVKSWFDDTEWYQFPLLFNNNIIGNADKVCPKTINILRKLKNIKIAGFSLLLPNTKMPLHNDETGRPFGTMASNLPLMMNTGQAILTVRDKIGKYHRYEHKLGKMVIFDSTNKHYAENNDDKNIRVILYLDFKTRN